MSVFYESEPLPLEQDHFRRILRWEQTQNRRLGRHRMQRYYENARYFYGDNEDPDSVQQPLGIRYVPIVHQKHTHYLFGEWEHNIVDWVVKPWDVDDPDDPQFETSRAIEKCIYKLMRRSDANSIIYKGALDGSIYGDTVFKVSWDPFQKRAGIETILPEYFHAIWHPLNPNQTLECVVAFNMDRNTAQALYQSPGVAGFVPTEAHLNPQMAVVWEYWNPYQMMVAVDTDVVTQEPNLYMKRDVENVQPGMLPFVHIPNLAINGEYWGFGDGEPILKLADELNFRLADMGDIINYHAHPITLLRKFFGKVDELPVSADAVWDLGREGEADYLEWGGPPPQTMEYIEMLIRILLETTNLTPVAFGKIEQSQASSAALNIEMLPIIEVVRRKRSNWSPALRDLVIKLMTLEAMVLNRMRNGKFKDIYGFNIEDLDKYEIKPKWAPILPRDRLQLVNEQVGLLSNEARSILYSLSELGVDDPTVERKRIMEDYKEKLEIEAQVNMDIADHEAEIQKDLTKTEADANAQNMELQMQQSKLEHKHAMEQDPTTDPERHERNIEQIKTEHDQERKTLQTKAQTATTVAKAKVAVARVSARKSSSKAQGGSNTDGGS